jgi:hypothetical protein
VYDCDSSRYPTIAVSESRHAFLGLFLFLRPEGSCLITQDCNDCEGRQSLRRAKAGIQAWVFSFSSRQKASCLITQDLDDGENQRPLR